jgi:hypothetical protein
MATPRRWVFVETGAGDGNRIYRAGAINLSESLRCKRRGWLRVIFVRKTLPYQPTPANATVSPDCSFEALSGSPRETSRSRDGDRTPGRQRSADLVAGHHGIPKFALIWRTELVPIVDQFQARRKRLEARVTAEQTHLRDPQGSWVQP